VHRGSEYENHYYCDERRSTKDTKDPRKKNMEFKIGGYSENEEKLNCLKCLFAKKVIMCQKMIRLWRDLQTNLMGKYPWNQ